MSRDFDLSSLSPSECILLAEQLWERASRHQDDIPLPPTHLEELNRRLDAIASGNMGPGEPWEVVRDRLWKR